MYAAHKPVRPWALGKIHDSETGFYLLTGRINRTPGLYRRADPDTGKTTDEFMTHTNERVHSSVRMRLDLEGLGLDDVGPYKCPALMSRKNGPWELRRLRIKVRDPIKRNSQFCAVPSREGPVIGEEEEDVRWCWTWGGDKDSEDSPLERIMIEEVLGPFERRLLGLSEGMSNLSFGEFRAEVVRVLACSLISISCPSPPCLRSLSHLATLVMPMLHLLALRL